MYTPRGVSSKAVMSKDGRTVSSAIKALLRPIVRLCVRHSLKIQDVEQLLKELFVAEARAVLDKLGEEPSVSRLSVMTGLQRPAVSDLLGAQPQPADAPESASNLLVKVIGAWQTSVKFTTKSGKPRLLEAEGKESEFAQLVRSVSRALNPYTVLFELERAGAVTRRGRFVKLRRGALVVDRDIGEGLHFLASDTEDLTEAVQENLFEKPALPNHHLTTEFDSIPVAAVERARAIVLREGHRLHARMRRLLGALDSEISGDSRAADRVRVCFSSFSRVQSIEGKE